MTLGRPYVAPAARPASRAQQTTVRRLVREATWAEPSYLADGTAEVAYLDSRGIIERIVTVFADGTTTV